jgi:hypothetical protein
MGSGVAILERWFDAKPQKVILSDFCKWKDATLEEAQYLSIFVGHKLFTNFVRTRARFISPGSLPLPESLERVQQMVLEAETRYLKDYPNEIGTMSMSPIWVESLGVKNFKKEESRI